MITYLIINLFLHIAYVLTLPLRLLNDVPANSSFTAAINSSGAYLAVFNQIFDLTEFFVLFSIFLAIEISIFVYKIIMWLIKKIPTIS